MTLDERAPAVRISRLTKSFGRVDVLRGLDLDVPPGSITALLGPSGCGKTTLLRAVAGFADPDSGTITVDGREVFGAGRTVPARERRIGYVAQEGALFPHRDVAANISFGLDRVGLRRRSSAHAARIDELLELVGLDAGMRHRAPHQLSGGQQQRVALARALAPNPALMLLDEPFSSLDAQLREETGRATVAALRAAGITAILVTHDQNEALSLADRIAVMHQGVVLQCASPTEIYHRPANAQVARTLGHANILSATIADSAADTVLGRLPVVGAGAGRAEIVVRPEQILIDPDGVQARIPARVVDVVYYGHDCMTHLVVGESTLLAARITGDRVPVAGDEVRIEVSGAVHAVHSS